jgi:ubiquinone/menaquinone biosynthesis C-methylase UbiE
MKDYYDSRASEYDDWYFGVRKFSRVRRPGWEIALRRLQDAIAALPPRRTLDVACGTGFLSQGLHGKLTLLDQSARMLRVARSRLPDATSVLGDALALPFDDHSFERVFAAHFYGHLLPEERAQFLGEARRVASELVIVDAAIHPSVCPEQWERRVVNDGSEFSVFKRYFDPAQLASELGGGELLESSRWFVLVRSAF